jgi:hypothetical protein
MFKQECKETSSLRDKIRKELTEEIRITELQVVSEELKKKLREKICVQ